VLGVSFPVNHGGGWIIIVMIDVMCVYIFVTLFFSITCIYFFKTVCFYFIKTSTLVLIRQELDFLFLEARIVCRAVCM